MKSIVAAARFALPLFLLAAIGAFADGGTWTGVSIVVANNRGGETALQAGVSTSATDSLDALLGEHELPPVPPNDIFDARFVSFGPSVHIGNGSFTDIRLRPAALTFSVTWHLAYQAGGAAGSVTIRLPGAFSPTISRITFDGKAAKPGDSIVTAFGMSEIILTIDYDFTPVTFAANPSSVTFAVGNRDTALPPQQTVTITPSVAGAPWFAVADDGWIDVAPGAGAGNGSIAIAIKTLAFADGRSSGTVRIYDAPAHAPTIVEVNVDHVTSARTAADAGAFSLDAGYPNPAAVSAGEPVRIEFTLSRADAVDLRVYDLRGREIRELAAAAVYPAGPHTTIWDGTDARGVRVAPGVYLYRIAVRGHAAARTVVLR